MSSAEIKEAIEGCVLSTATLASDPVTDVLYHLTLVVEKLAAQVASLERVLHERTDHLA